MRKQRMAHRKLLVGLKAVCDSEFSASKRRVYARNNSSPRREGVIYTGATVSRRPELDVRRHICRRLQWMSTRREQSPALMSLSAAVEVRLEDLTLGSFSFSFEDVLEDALELFDQDDARPSLPSLVRGARYGTPSKIRRGSICA